jgi:FkbM family methyltransferase
VEVFESWKPLVARWMCHPWIGRAIGLAFSDRIPFRGGRLWTDDPAVSDQTRASVFWGFYEKAEATFVDRFLRPDLDVVELGSSIGGISGRILRRLGPGRRLVCVEANPELLGILRRNVARGLADGRVEVVHGAIAYGAGPTVEIQIGAANIAGRLVDGGPATGCDRCVEVPAIALREVLEKAGFGPYALVCDIEGAERMLLDEDAASLAGCLQVVAELHSPGGMTGVRQLVRRFEALGFQVCAHRRPVYLFERTQV